MHHVTQRGNRMMAVFFSDADCSAYLALLREFSGEYGIEAVSKPGQTRPFASAAM